MSMSNSSVGPTNQPLTPIAWEERYQTQKTGWDLGKAAPPFVELLSGTTAPAPGKTIVLGMGRGYDALFFASQGFAVTGVDFAPSAIAASRSQAAVQQVTVETLERDIFQLVPEFTGQFDYVVEHTCFCALDPSLRPDYIQLVWDLLRPGGELIALFWAHNRAGGPPFGASVEELKSLFSRFETVSFELSTHSLPSRQGDEYLARLRKP
jgi:methyl halide transferase